MVDLQRNLLVLHPPHYVNSKDKDHGYTGPRFPSPVLGAPGAAPHLLSHVGPSLQLSPTALFHFFIPISL